MKTPPGTTGQRFISVCSVAPDGLRNLGVEESEVDRLGQRSDSRILVITSTDFVGHVRHELLDSGDALLVELGDER